MTGLEFLAGAMIRFVLFHLFHTASVAYLASYPLDTEGFFLGVKQPGRKTNHSTPSSAEVKNA